MVFCFLVAPGVAEYREQVRSVLRADALHLILGILIILLGACAVGLFSLRKRTKDAALLWFAVFAVLYGLRLLLDTDTVPFALRFPAGMAGSLRMFITYVIPIPGMLFGYEVVPALRSIMRWLVWFTVAFAVAGIAADLISGRPGTLHTANNVITLAVWLSFGVIMFLRGEAFPKSPSLRAGLAIFGVTVVLGNLRGLGLRLPFDPEPLGFACFLAVLGRLLAIRSFENEDRLVAINKELEIATRIQLSIIPSVMPESDRFRIAAEYRPMTSVAGDFFDFLRVDANRLGILIADVSGHGVPAALIASMVKVAIAAQLPHADDPARVLAGMNQVLCGKMQGQFVSAAYLYLDFETSQMRYGAGGHPPLLWWQESQQRVESLEQNGLILGIMPHASYTFAELPLTPGDRFLLYTDGLIEGANTADEFFGDERARQALSETRALSPADCARTILDRLGRFAGHDRGRTQDDDLTVIVIQVA